jgi:uncharacterized damage-inducible protein DinB
MNKEDIAMLYQYNQWSTAKILGAAADVSEAEFLAPANFPHGGLRSTLVHALFAEWIWRSRWEGSSPTQRIKPEEFPTFGSLRARWAEEENRLMGFVNNLTDHQLKAVLPYKTTQGTPQERILWQMMAHLVNHSTQHKTEAATMLTWFGHSPSDIDMIYFLIENY